jgi:uncharacterized protein (TIGR04222 family)
MEPWGLSGPEFVGWYLVGLVGAIFLTLIVSWALRHRRVPVGQPQLTVDEAAVLAGGRMRAIDTAVAGLIENGTLRVQRDGRLQAVPGGRARGELEQAVFGLVRDFRDYGGLPLLKVRKTLRDHPSLVRIESSLADRRLVVPRSRLTVAGAALPLFVVAGVGLARLINGVRLDRPVGLLSFLLIVTAFVILGALRRPSPWRTHAGADVRAELVDASAKKPGRVPLSLPAGAAALVAVGGLVAFPDPETADVFRTVVATGSSVGGGSSWFGGGHCSGGGSSCGGASSCGGGGGCGSGGGGCGG